MQFLYLIFLIFKVRFVIAQTFDNSEEILIDIDLPENHLSQYFNKVPELAKKLKETSNGPYKDFLNSEKYDRDLCWGYEYDCKKPLLTHKCPGNHTGYVQSKEAQLDVFYAQADFGKFLVVQGHQIFSLFYLRLHQTAA
jgi:EGF domain-specific O-GlcNAc transferase